jgi:hypothetical protein
MGGKLSSKAKGIARFSLANDPKPDKIGAMVPAFGETLKANS